MAKRWIWREGKIEEHDESDIVTGHVINVVIDSNNEAKSSCVGLVIPYTASGQIYRLAHNKFCWLCSQFEDNRVVLVQVEKCRSNEKLVELDSSPP